MNNEVWRPIRGFEKVYTISNYGFVRSYHREKVVTLTPHLTTEGYSRYWLRWNGKTRYVTAHVLVLENFVGPRPKGFDACHFDGKPWHNHLSNLRWASRKDNIDEPLQYWYKETLKCRKALKAAIELVDEISGKYLDMDEKYDGTLASYRAQFIEALDSGTTNQTASTGDK